MQNLDVVEPVGSLNKPLKYSLLVRQPHLELQTGNGWTAKRQR